jgi:hypothetical protein
MTLLSLAALTPPRLSTSSKLLIDQLLFHAILTEFLGAYFGEAQSRSPTPTTMARCVMDSTLLLPAPMDTSPQFMLLSLLQRLLPPLAAHPQLLLPLMLLVTSTPSTTVQTALRAPTQMLKQAVPTLTA